MTMGFEFENFVSNTNEKIGVFSERCEDTKKTKKSIASQLIELGLQTGLNSLV